MLEKYVGFTKEPLQDFYVNLTYASNGLVSFASRAAASLWTMASYSKPGLIIGGLLGRDISGDPGADLEEIWSHMPGDQFNMEADANASPDGGVPTWGNTPGALGSAIAKGMQQHARRDRLDINARVEWGNPRQMALSMEDMLTSAAQRAYAVRLESDSLAAYPG